MRPNLLYSTTGPLVGASYTDLHARAAGHPGDGSARPAGRRDGPDRGACGGSCHAGGSGPWSGTSRWRCSGGVSFPLVMQKLVVAPTELTRETPYLKDHIAATRAAWGLDSVDTRELNGEADLTLADIRANSATIENVRLWDREPLLQTFGQLQEIRTYYDFVSVDDDRYWIDGKYRQVLLSPRELNPASLPTRTFINEHLTFTHGMGLTLSPVNQVTTEGLPVLFIRDLPPVSDVSLKVTRPQIYFGEIANDFVFVGHEAAGVRPSVGRGERLRLRTRGAAGSRSATCCAGWCSRCGSARPRSSCRRTSPTTAGCSTTANIAERAARALPFLRFDRDPVHGGHRRRPPGVDRRRATRRPSGYPYAQRLADGTSYMRNSVKLVIDAYDGTLTAYASAPADPIIRTWAKVFPGIFQPLDSMPADLRAHIRYPDDLYRVQTTLYTSYHMEAPEDFYHREDQWQIPVVAEAKETVPFMRHIVMRLPDEPKAEFIYMVPFTPRGKDNLAAWMVARNDGDAYGKLRVYRLSRQSLVFGPQQIENRINQDTEISRQVSLWDQGGSKVIRGDLLVIPIEQSLLYVQPLYLQAEGGRIPELKRVVVAYQNQVVMEETLDAGLARLFGGSAAKNEPAAGPEPPLRRPPRGRR